MIKNIQLEILSNLPNWEAHKKMAPSIRNSNPIIPEDVRYSAVCILLFYKNEILHTLLMKRTEDGSTHSGQISFLGGKYEANDFSLNYTATRECEEEIGLHQDKMQILGNLSKLYIPPSNFMVTPIVCFVENINPLNPSPIEVAELLEVPLDDFFKEENKATTEIKRRNTKNVMMQTPIYKYQKHIIWGATAMILSELETIYKRVL